MSTPLPPRHSRSGLCRRGATIFSLVMIFLAGAVIGLRPAAAEVRNIPQFSIRDPSTGLLPYRPVAVALFSVTRSFGLNLGYTAMLEGVLQVENLPSPTVKPARKKEKTTPGMELLALTGEAVRKFLLDALTVGGKLPLKFDECTSAYMTIAPDFYRSADRVIADETFLDPIIYARNISKGYGFGLGLSYRR